ACHHGRAGARRGTAAGARRCERTSAVARVSTGCTATSDAASLASSRAGAAGRDRHVVQRPRGTAEAAIGGRVMPARIYSDELADALCAEIAENGTGPKAACAKLGINHGTMLKWLVLRPDFKARYDQAQQLRCDVLSEELITIADEAVGLDAAGVQAARVR